MYLKVADRVGDAKGRLEHTTRSETLLDLIETATGGLLPRARRQNVAPEFLREAQTEILGELLPAFSHPPDRRIALTQRPIVRSASDGHPMLAHVLKARDPDPSLLR